MQHRTKIAVFMLAVSGLFAGRIIAAEAPAASPAASSQEAASAEPKKCDRGDDMEKRLQTLHNDLKLNPTQEAAWTEWAGKIKGDKSEKEARRKEFEATANLPAPERMEKMLAFAKEHIAKLETRLAATKTFYATLTPEQRLIFDKGFTFEHQGRHGRHGHWKE